MPVLVAEGVGEDEGVEAIVLGRYSIALPGPSGDPGRHREHGMAPGLQVLDQEPLGALQGDRCSLAVAAQLVVEIGSPATSWVTRRLVCRRPLASTTHT